MFSDHARNAFYEHGALSCDYYELFYGGHGGASVQHDCDAHGCVYDRYDVFL